MPLGEMLTAAYRWAEGQAPVIVLACVAWGVLGTLLARMCKRYQTARGGRAIADVVIGGAVLVLVVAVLALTVAHVGFKKGLLDANVWLLGAPLLCVLVSVLGIHWVFPISELATVRTLRDVALFMLAAAAALWLLSTFRGWGVLFLGGIVDIVVVAGLVFALLRVLYRRAF